MTARLRLRLGPTGRGWIELDGETISGALNGVDLHSRVGQATVATLHLPAVELAADVDVRLRMPAETWDLLVADGWTPPPHARVCTCAGYPGGRSAPSCPLHGDGARP